MEITDNRKSKKKTVEIVKAQAQYRPSSPMPNYVIIKQGDKEATYGDQHIVIPDFIQKAPNQGVIVAVAATHIIDGHIFKNEDIKIDGENSLKPGDLVTFGRFNVEDIQIDGDDYVLCNIADIKLVSGAVYAYTA